MLNVNEIESLNQILNIDVENYIKSVFEQANFILKHNENFIDALFPPNEKSIGAQNSNLTVENSEKINKLPQYFQDRMKNFNLPLVKKFDNDYQWKRISEIYPENYLLRIMKDEDELIDDVMQGDLGDCYFLSALSALAERKIRIERMFKNANEGEKINIFTVDAFINGKPIEIVLDDYFPVINKKIYNNNADSNNELFKEETNLAFSKIEEVSKNIWPLLLEKAWAKVNGCYKNIVEGNVAQAFEFLTPSPVEINYHNLDQQDFASKTKLWNMIKEADQQDFIICCDISEKPDDISISIISSIGLLSGHAYSIISVYEIKTRSGELVALLKIRNPWGSLEWNGEWSDSSDLWTPELRKQLKNEKEKDDGIFYMSFKDYCRFFTCTYICKYNINYNYAWKEFTNDGGIKLISLKIDGESNSEHTAYISLSQKTSKIYKNLAKLPFFNNFFASFLVFKNENNSYKYLGSVSGKSDKITFENSFSSGEYIIAVKFPNNLNNTEVFNFDEYLVDLNSTIESGKNNFVIGFYSSFKHVSFDYSPIEINFENLLFNSLIQYADSSKDYKEYFHQEGESNIWRFMNFNSEKDSCGYLVYKNESNAIINEILTINKFTNMRVIPMTKYGLSLITKEEDLDFYEDEFENKMIQKLIEKEKIENVSSFYYSKNLQNAEISDDNLLRLNIKIAPLSYFVLIYEKTDDYTVLKYDSDIYLEYPISYLWSERKFIGKKQKIKYKNSSVDIFESIIRHPNGILIKYKNKTREYKFEVKIDLGKMENLEFKNNIIFINESGSEKGKNSFEHNSNEKKLKIILNPGECIFADLKAINPYDGFSLSTQMEYQIMLA